MFSYQTYIDGKWVDAASGKTFQTFDPYTGEPWAAIPECEKIDVDRAVEAASRAFEAGPWPNMTPTERGKIMRRIAQLIEKHSEYLGQIEVRDNGKLISEMAAQTKYMPEWFYYYGGLADKIQGAVVRVDRPEHFTYILREPVGVCAFITPWNSPLMLATWKMAPALAAGCTMVIKPSEFTSASLLEFMKLVIEESGLPPGVVNVVTGYGAVTGEPLVTHPKVAKVAFTGGSATGARVNELAAKTFKKVSLELGGKSPNIVFDDCILDDAVSGAVSGIFAATGQTCIAGSRLLLQESIHDKFVEKLVAMAKTARLGNPSLAETQVGPVTTPPQYQKILSYIDIAKEEGAKCVLGGGRHQGGGRRQVFRQADYLHGRQQQDAHCAGGGVRSGSVGHQVQGRGRGGADSQRHRIRTRRRRLDPVPQARAHDGRPHQGRHGVGEHLSGGELPDAVRRLQSLRPRPREWRRGDRGISAIEKRVD